MNFLFYFLTCSAGPQCGPGADGTTVKILTCTVVVKEVSSSTIGGEIGGRREDYVSGGGDGTKDTRGEVGSG